MPPAARTRPDGSMSLLVEVMTDTLDSSYREAAARRAGTPARDRRGSSRARRRTVVPLLVLGALTGTAAAQVRGRATDVSQGRAALVAEVDRRTQASGALEEQVTTLRAQLAREQAGALGASAAGRRAAVDLEALEVQAGTLPVRGPGVVVRLDDAPRAAVALVGGRGGSADTGRVLDRDLQDAVNGLWAAGAEAVSVNDLRLTALTAIRSAGAAVLVDFRPLSPPYLLRAVGPAALEQRFTGGPTGRRLAGAAGRYGLGLQVRADAALRLPAAGVPDLRTSRTP